MKIVIIGSGPAGVTVAETLRNEGFRDEIMMFSGEDAPPYAPAVLASFFEEGGETIFWKGRDFCQRHGITCRQGQWIDAVRPADKIVITRSGEQVPYDKLVIATGSTLYAPIACHCTEPLREGETRFFDFKSMTAALKIRQRVRDGEVHSAVVVGAGFIGTEIALVLADAGVQVTQIEMMNRVMPRMLDEETASYAEQVIRERGVDLRLNTKGVEFKGRRMADTLVLATGEHLHADMFIAATGIRPNVAFLRGSGLPVQHGLIVNDALEAGSPDILAAGDVAETVDVVTGKRYVHALHPNAVAQGILVAHNILGYERTYAGAENINSLKHLGLPVVAVGEISGDEELKEKDGKTLRKIILRDDRIVGFRLVGDIRLAGLYRSLMLRRENVSAYKRDLLRERFGAGWLISASGQHDFAQPRI